ncbi:MULTISPECIES: DUF4145 domain-containing protein [Salinivibrio]|uniref:DUF4145 domain-containing protein n=1 Tax=Salinivibrio TaxID=51366 RepID=UPI000985A587|nr:MULTISPECIES: DUF4145 domain-containing protein [Salinivibrio]OOF09282.1 DUF4145 domain-containing protein [Salinivibrio sp. PR919]OOF11867.1 DUF4145 domain-containing protein [Salinivibrio sp. PR5]OOF18787.1 DUF4145 domain-containing protein [Salinivibrio sp. PR932]OOF29675.1 DUF4145 domain-containing protein [Salinivibrio proteolyticus]
MDEVAVVIKHSRRLESLLRQHYHADGKGLHQLVDSCQKRLPNDVIGKLRFVATIRNKVVHEEGFEVDDLRQFVSVCKACEAELVPRSHRLIWRLAAGLIFLFTAGALWFYAQVWPQWSG